MCVAITISASTFSQNPEDFMTDTDPTTAKSSETELERAEKRYAQAKARLIALKNREATKARKLHTRRKIILGGALIDLAERDSNAATMIERLVRNLPREQDRKTFDGWDAKTASVAPAPGSDPVGNV
jgi:hypothetical protein